MCALPNNLTLYINIFMSSDLAIGGGNQLGAASIFLLTCPYHADGVMLAACSRMPASWLKNCKTSPLKRPGLVAGPLDLAGDEVTSSVIKFLPSGR